MKEIVIIGAGDSGKDVAWLIEDINKSNPTYIVLGFLDDDESKKGKNINGYDVLGPVSLLSQLNENHHACAVISMQNSRDKKKIVDSFPDFELWETLIHPSVSKSETSRVGKGCIICAVANISVNSIIEDHCLINVSVSVGNDCRIGSYVSTMPGSIISSHARVNDFALIGTNSVVMPYKLVGKYAKVWPGSVVTEDVQDLTEVLGVPAKKVL